MGMSRWIQKRRSLKFRTLERWVCVYGGTKKKISTSRHCKLVEGKGWNGNLNAQNMRHILSLRHHVQGSTRPARTALVFAGCDHQYLNVRAQASSNTKSLKCQSFHSFIRFCSLTVCPNNAHHFLHLPLDVFLLPPSAIQYFVPYSAKTSTLLISPSASPELTFLPVFAIVFSTVSYASVGSATTVAVCVSRETS